MLEGLKVRWNQFMEESGEKSFLDAMAKSRQKFVHFDRVVVPVYMNLPSLKLQLKEPEKGMTVDFAVVNKENADALGPRFRIKSRSLKCSTNTRCGYYAYAVALNGEFIGDIWCATRRDIGCDRVHPDCDVLAIRCAEDEAYMFDMYVAPEFRGKVVTSQLLGNALQHLKEHGIARVYGYYEKDNLPALWTHRLFGYKELPNRKVSRFFFYSTSVPVTVETS